MNWGGVILIFPKVSFNSVQYNKIRLICVWLLPRDPEHFLDLLNRSSTTSTETSLWSWLFSGFRKNPSAPNTSSSVLSHSPLIRVKSLRWNVTRRCLVDRCFFAFLLLKIYISYVYLIFHLWICRYVGRGVSASPATGSKRQHLKEAAQLLTDAFALWSIAGRTKYAVFK